MKLIIRKLEKKDYKPYKKLFEEAYYEYLENLRHSNPQQYRIEMKDQRKVTSSRFNFYVQTGNSFIAERDGIVVSYIAAQTIPYMRGHDKVLWIEYIVTKKEHRRQGIAAALLGNLKDYAKQHRIDSIYATINPNNTASIELHRKLGFNVRNWTTASIQTQQQATTAA
jgi:RimJ/RimL family protein N-acetyltransferase